MIFRNPIHGAFKKNIFIRKIVQEFRMKHRTWFKGVNVILTYRCNLACDYCYEQGTKFNFEDMSLLDFENLLKWLRKNGKRKIILLGGEPTQHREFSKILKLVDDYDFHTVILSNLLFDESIIKSIEKHRAPLLIQANINQKNTYSGDDYETVVSNSRYLQNKISTLVLRYNLYSKNYDFYDIVDLAKELRSPIRFSITNSPIACEGKSKRAEKHRDFFNNDRDIINAFLSECKKNRVAAFFARPVPKCLFFEKEIKEYAQNGIKFKCYIGQNNDYAARLNVNPDLSIVACYGVPIPGPKITEFAHYRSLSAFFKKDILTLRKIPLMEECVHCADYGNGKCQGGCLSEKKEWDI